MYTITKALVLDLDGTVRRSKSGKEFAEGPDDIELIPGIEERIMLYKAAGYLVLGITNQGGVAFGYKTRRQVNLEITATARLFKEDPFQENIWFSPFHPKGSVAPYNVRTLCRKPEIGMLVEMEKSHFARETVIDWDNSLFVGDRPEDQECAKRAGIPFEWATAFHLMPVSILFQKLNALQ